MTSDGGADPDSEPDPVEVGVELLSKLEHPELTVAEAVDRIETVTTPPATTRKILDEAEKRGVIDREDGIVKPTRGGYVSFQSEVVTKEGDFSCRRCGASISTGHFIKLDAGEHGPFGPECIRKVTGRD
ncbi:MarR family transcriptional regulator [Halobacteriales archaeon SW_6_65_15]|nr:MAG: MarR family transcriptional regulator [Halobacteriales archaeon SW_6_65_15]